MKRRDPGFRSMDFTPAGRARGKHKHKGQRYLLSGIPAGFWAEVRAKALREETSVRALILGMLRDWLAR